MLLLLALPAKAQGQFGYTTDNGTITITGYTGPGGAVSVPGIINGLPVTRIGDNAFLNQSSLTGVTIPNSVTNVGSYAFGGCSSLTSVTIPDSVTRIGDEAFYYCTGLTAITVDALNSSFSSVDGVLFDRNQTTLIEYPGGKAGSYTIPNSVTRIGNSAFSGCTSLTSVMISDSVTSIGNNAFYYCTGLTSATIGSGVTGIPQGSFYDCARLGSVTIPNSVTSIGVGAFQVCASLTNIIIPNSVTDIGDQAFYYCTGLTGVTIGNGVTSIGDEAFYYCTGLTGVYFQGNAPSLGSSVFGNDNNAAIYYLPGTTGWGPMFAGRPTALWSLPNPVILNSGPSFGVQTNGFGFIISWTTNLSVVVEACTNLVNPAWSPVGTNNLTSGWSYFNDLQWTNYPARLYRLRSP